MTNDVYLSIGTNLGNREHNLKSAIQALRKKVTIKNISKVYETEPVGGVKQDDFLNIAVEIKTTMSPHELLEFLHEIEKGLHRIRKIHWGPRTIDLDILFFNKISLKENNLIIPHPEIKNRNFVLIPMLEITNNDRELHDKIKGMMKNTNDQNSVREYKMGAEKLE
ncbi:2-amino-4-hydroxy-6-hydroxymethyldihydropteridine diphosphokinase [Pediococcus stilesii]|uniref:2-amino-4-hydroxy-6-hydroxymethyldihydropteridine diphosphokinase n=1 Tax=Pediococcus stilesii TaxID=331679 RepID=A0A5R9BTB8_9LACO|nr:2-amino-4-hydroxy-6-hydroxymethyldihydropteridine diphosphokinase [Pediococcus stilesii]TLQ03453.1 2-amino-4-hydroxy-6-hydroxymethyldihydropteridine diphosphokinase [Pediococcus stilesii]